MARIVHDEVERVIRHSCRFYGRVCGWCERCVGLAGAAARGVEAHRCPGRRLALLRQGRLRFAAWRTGAVASDETATGSPLPGPCRRSHARRRGQPPRLVPTT